MNQRVGYCPPDLSPAFSALSKPWELTCKVRISWPPWSSGFQLDSASGRHQEIRGCEKNEIRVFIPQTPRSQASAEQCWIPPAEGLGSCGVAFPSATALSQGSSNPSACFFRPQINTIASLLLLVPFNPAHIFVNSWFIKPFLTALFECAKCFIRPWLISWEGQPDMTDIERSR